MTPPPGTKLRNIRVPDGLWNAAKQIAAARGETVTDVIRAALHRYIRTHRDQLPADPPDRNKN